MYITEYKKGGRLRPPPLFTPLQAPTASLHIEWSERTIPFQYLLGGIAMPEKVMPGPVQDSACIREAVCIHTKKIYDSCKEEDMAPYI